MLEKFVARQPILDQRLRLYGYELLFRSGAENFFRPEFSERASSTVMVDSFLLHGMESLIGGKRGFFNCTRDTLVNEYAVLLPRDRVVLEILETVEPDEDVLDACRKLKHAGYMLALDDFDANNKFKTFTELADIIKIDFAINKPESRRYLAQKYLRPGIKLLAEKVETLAEYQEAKDMGYSLFQGYFFGRPEMVSSQDIPVFKQNYLRILQEINRPELDLQQLENIVKCDPSLVYKLLRYLNSAYFGFRNEIKSIKHSFTLLGLIELKKLISLIVMASMATDKPEELILSSVIRANFCESLSTKLGVCGREFDLFLLGLLSLMDAILDRPLPEILESLGIDKEILSALTDHKNRFSEVLDLVVSYERGDWQTLSKLITRLNLDEDDIPPIYLKSVEGARQFSQAQ
jgi:c-di-GMP-related signal transduction protein